MEGIMELCKQKERKPNKGSTVMIETESRRQETYTAQGQEDQGLAKNKRKACVKWMAPDDITKDPHRLWFLIYANCVDL